MGNVKTTTNKRRAPKKGPPKRTAQLSVLLALLLVGILARAFVLQALRNQPLRKMAEEQILTAVEVTARRGAIYDRSGNALAVSNRVASVFAHPHRVVDLKSEAVLLAKRLALPLQEVKDKLSSDRLFVWLKRRIDPRQADEVGKLALVDVGVIPETRRYYPNRTLFSHLLGGVDIDGKGIEGIESALDDELAGVPASASGLRDARGHTMLFDDVTQTPGIQGNDLYLTVDRELQQLAAAALADGVEQVHGKAGTAIVLDPKTGGVLALANYPEYNPNVFDKVSIATRRNRATSDSFEPGSSFKTIMMAGALEEGVIRPNDQVFCENGHFALGGKTIHDVHQLGLITAKQIIQSSSNIGAAKIGIQLGRERFEHYIAAFGFGQKTGLELPGEAVGIVRPAKKWPLIQLATVSFGQGISITAMQLAQAYAVVANGGVLLKPHLVERVQSPDGTQRVLPRPAAVRVVSPQTAEALGAMLEGVVSDKGTGAKAEIAGVRVAGKTATAQKVDPALGGYAPDKFVANFAGYVPAEDPRFVIVVVVDEPSKAFHFGGLSAAPIFQKIATGALRQAGLLPATQTEVAAVPQSTAEDETSEDTSEVALGIVPDVRGLMLGEAFDVLKRAGVSLEPEVQGSGRIVSQDPAPGGFVSTRGGGRDGKLHLILASARGGRDAAH